MNNVGTSTIINIISSKVHILGYTNAETERGPAPLLSHCDIVGRLNHRAKRLVYETTALLPLFWFYRPVDMLAHATTERTS